ncbi:MAG: hypothetical protein ACYDAG_03915 [Chloroflexota bacterium]
MPAEQFFHEAPTVMHMCAHGRLHDPLLSEAHKRFARHHGFIVSPNRPRTPEHKGKVEAGCKLGLGGACPHCDEPLLALELLDSLP